MPAHHLHPRTEYGADVGAVPLLEASMHLIPTVAILGLLAVPALAQGSGDEPGEPGHAG